MLDGKETLVLKIFVDGTWQAVDEFWKHICKCMGRKKNCKGVEIYTLSERGTCWCGFPPRYHYVVCIPNCKETHLKSVAVALWEAYQTFTGCKFKIERMLSPDEIDAILRGEPFSREEKEEAYLPASDLSVRVYLGSGSDDHLERFVICDFSKNVMDKEDFINLLVERTLNIFERETAQDAQTFKTVLVPKAGFLITWSETWIRRR